MRKKWMVLTAVLAVLLLCAAASAEGLPYISVYPRETLPTGAALEYVLGNFDKSTDQYVHVLRRQADGSLASVAVVKGWDAAAGTLVTRVEANVINEPGAYCLTLGPERNYTGTETSRVAVAEFTVLSERLTAPIFEGIAHGGTAGTDITGTVVFPTGMKMGVIQVGRLGDGGFEEETWNEVYWSGTTEISFLGLYTTTPGTYQIRAVACTHYGYSAASATVADSETAIYDFTLTAANIPACPTPVLDKREADYDPNSPVRVSFTVRGAEAVAYTYHFSDPYTGEEIGGIGSPNSCEAGDTGSVRFYESGLYHLTIWAKINGVWSSPNDSATFLLRPLGLLETPRVLWQDQELDGALTVTAIEPLTFTAFCEDADSVYCEVTEYQNDGSMEWIDWLSVNGGETAVFDLNDLGLSEGRYRLRFGSTRPGWLSKGDRAVDLTVTPFTGVSGRCGKNLIWTLNGQGVLNIVGTGAMTDYSYSEPAPWSEYPVTKAIIGEGVTAIGSWAFRRMTGLQSVSIPATVTRIGAFAFQSCSGLTGKLVIPHGVVRIEEYAFIDCSGMTGLVLPGTLEYIGTGAFTSCGLTSVEAAEGVAVKNHIFYYGDYENPADCFAVLLALPAGVDAVDCGTFGFCRFPHAAPDFVSPSSLTAVKAQAFSGTAFTFVWLADQTVSIESGAFSGCAQLRCVRIPEGCTSIGPEAFPAGTVILGTEGSEAEAYASENGLPFVPLFVGWGNG